MLTAAGGAVGLAVTVAILGTPYLRFAYYSPELHLVLDSVDACIAVLLAYLLIGRLRRRGRLQDLVLAEGLLLLATAGFGLALLAHLVADDVRESLGVWLPVALRTAATVLIAVSSVIPDVPARPVRIRQGVTVPSAAVLAGVTVLWLLRDSLPVAVDESAPAAAHSPVISGHPALIAAQAVGAACFLVASVAFTVQARRRSDELLRWLGPACALSGFARINYVLFPSLYSGWVYTGDLLRTAGYACLLVGAAREINRYWSAQAQVAVVEDRRRLARELHDGVVQELSWIKSEARGMASTRAGAEGGAVGADSSPLRTQPIVDACERALDEARAAIDALGRDTEEPLGYALHRAAREVAERHGGRVVVELDDSVAADPRQRHGLARITREAVGNALRHGAAEHVRITLETTPGGRRLVVHDDGRGFDVGEAEDGFGFGLTSMRERAHLLPGALRLHSAPGLGTTVEVTW